jgi:hypothetical protein
MVRTPVPCCAHGLVHSTTVHVYCSRADMCDHFKYINEVTSSS